MIAKLKEISSQLESRINPVDEFNAEMRKTRTLFVKQVRESKKNTETLNKIKLEKLKEKELNQLNDIKEFKELRSRIFAFDLKKVPENKTISTENYVLKDTEDHQQRLDYLLALYHATENFVTFTNLSKKIDECVDKPPVRFNSIQKMIQLRNDALDAEKMDLHLVRASGFNKRTEALKDILMENIDGKPGVSSVKAGIEKKQEEEENFRMLRNVDLAERQAYLKAAGLKL